MRAPACPCSFAAHARPLGDLSSGEPPAHRRSSGRRPPGGRARRPSRAPAPARRLSLARRPPAFSLHGARAHTQARPAQRCARTLRPGGRRVARRRQGGMLHTACSSRKRSAGHGARRATPAAAVRMLMHTRRSDADARPLIMPAAARAHTAQPAAQASQGPPLAPGARQPRSGLLSRVAARRQPMAQAPGAAPRKQLPGLGDRQRVVRAGRDRHHAHACRARPRQRRWQGAGWAPHKRLAA